MTTTMPNSAAQAGRDLAAIVRTDFGSDDDRVRQIFRAICVMLDTTASTPEDALALAAVAHQQAARLSAEAIPLDVGDEDIQTHLVAMLLKRIVETLEVVAQTPAGTFTGATAPLN